MAIFLIFLITCLTMLLIMLLIDHVENELAGILLLVVILGTALVGCIFSLNLGLDNTIVRTRIERTITKEFNNIKFNKDTVIKCTTQETGQFSFYPNKKECIIEGEYKKI